MYMSEPELIEFTNGYKAWYLNGLRHREDGPAIDWGDGRKRWFLNDKEYTEEEYALIQFMNGKNIHGIIFA